MNTEQTQERYTLTPAIHGHKLEIEIIVPGGANYPIGTIEADDDSLNAGTELVRLANAAALLPELVEALEGLIGGVESCILITDRPNAVLKASGLRKLLEPRFAEARAALAKCKEAGL